MCHKVKNFVTIKRQGGFFSFAIGKGLLKYLKVFFTLKNGFISKKRPIIFIY